MRPASGLASWADYLQTMRRHARATAVLMFGGLLIGLFLAQQEPRTYSATTSIVMAEVPKYVVAAPTNLAPPAVSIDTDAQFLQSQRVMSAVGTTLGITPAEAMEHLSVTASASSHVLHVTVEAASPELAVEASTAAVAALVDVRRRALLSLQPSQLRHLRAEIAEDERTSLRGPDELLVVPAVDEGLEQLLARRAALDELEEAQAEPARVIDRAASDVRSDYANTEVPIVSGAMLGLFSACLLGAARDRHRGADSSGNAHHAHHAYPPVLTIPEVHRHAR